MSQNKKHKACLLIVGLVLVYIIYAIATGGVYVSSLKDFGGQANVALSSEVKSDLWIAPTRTEWGIPFVAHYYGAAEPYSLRV